jgi:hypothetical protein
LADLLHWLRQADATDQVEVLLGRDPAAHVSFYWPQAAIALLNELKEMGAEEQYTRLAERMTTAPLEITTNMSVLLNELRRTGRYTNLLNRDPVAINEPRAMARLLSLLSEGGMQNQVTALADHAAAAPVERPRDVASLLHALNQANAKTQASMLASRAATAAPLDDAGAVAMLLKTMRDAGADEQVDALLDRSPAAHASLDHPYYASRLLEALQQVNARQQVSIVMDRLPGEGSFEIWIQEGHIERFHFGREADGSPAQPWNWDDLG